MKFYCLYDLLNYTRIQNGDSVENMYRFFRKKNLKKSDIDFFKENCSIYSVPGIMEAVQEYTKMSALEIEISLGILSQKNSNLIFTHLSDIVKLLDDLQEDTVGKKENSYFPYFQTANGTLYNGDCINIMQHIKSNSIDTIFADPPFNLNKVYDEGIDDNLDMTEYLSWSYKWIDESIRILKPGGSLFIYNLPKWSIYYASYLNKRLTFRDWIAINMKFNLPLSGRLYPAHYALLYYIKGEKPNTFNGQRIPIQTCRHCGGEIKDYGGYKRKMNPNGVNVSDVWNDIYPVRHKRDKTRKYNELSLKMLDRIISMSTNTGDTVFDPFGGSGTTYIVAELLGRKWIGSELGDCSIIKSRFENIERDKENLRKVYQEKNVLFSEKAISLRKKNGFWL